MTSIVFLLIATTLNAFADDCGDGGRYANNALQVYPSTAVPVEGSQDWDHCLVDAYGEVVDETCEPDIDRPAYLTMYCHCADNGIDYSNGTVEPGDWMASHCDLAGQNCNGVKTCFSIDDQPNIAYGGVRATGFGIAW